MGQGELWAIEKMNARIIQLLATLRTAKDVIQRCMEQNHRVHHNPDVALKDCQITCCWNSRDMLAEIESVEKA